MLADISSAVFDLGDRTTMVKIIAIITASLVALATLGYFLTMSGGKPIGSDLSVIGQGKPVLVLAYENYSPTGGDALNRLRRISSDYDSQLDFVVADLGTPDGRAFANRHQLFDGQAVLLKRNGQPLGGMSIPADEKELRSRLESKLAGVE
ncbi:MAG: hypothetical protein ACI9LY_002821 [Arenicella sp.]|jgi:hypothetical protein